MDVRTGGPLLHSIFCTLAGVLFIAFFISAVVGPAWWSTPGEHRYDSWLGALLLVVGVAILFQIVLGVWVGIDASRRGMNGWLWGALTCFTCVVGLIVYLLSAQSSSGVGSSAMEPGGRAPEQTACPQCGSPTRAEFLACPHCGIALHRACPQCGRSVEPGWKFCSYCRERLDDGSPAGRTPGPGTPD